MGPPDDKRDFFAKPTPTVPRSPGGTAGIGKGFGCQPGASSGRGTGAGVRKPPKNEPAGQRRAVAVYGDLVVPAGLVDQLAGNRLCTGAYNEPVTRSFDLGADYNETVKKIPLPSETGGGGQGGTNGF